jgi:hypothetical protein
MPFAKDIVTVLGERRMEAEREAEKYFRASLAAAEFAYGAYSAMPSLHSIRSPRDFSNARGNGATAQQLRERVGEAMELGGIAELVLVASA